VSVRPQKGEVSSVAIEICTDRLEISNPSDPTYQMTFLNTKPLRKVDIDRG
jgi:predicted HTH transcriptional regulator